MVLYGLKTCDTCRKARSALGDAEFRDVREDGVPPDLLELAIARFGAAVTNTRSTTWRALDDEARARPQNELLQDHPTLMKRPLIVTEDEMYLGWSKDVQAALLG